ncbi:MAG: efflux transporter outer membrane subunit [Oryzomonas sp.]|uniref:efflux transporter outer membrane subunit n=1 Tax=Oryzomonas sp. TaxID=2855186 RepID=UPI00284734F9|nr:efflux transporter outer membrane subunit [Oryzomonas sp.]MDR3580465.1 efflux transporter outer membrane subunit [Oryzomonas sp.]
MTKIHATNRTPRRNNNAVTNDSGARAVRLTAGLLVAAVCLAMCGCMVGPDFHVPAAPAATGYTATALPAETVSTPAAGGAAQHFMLGADIPAQWWQMFHNPELDHLIRQALKDNPTLAAAQATLIQAQENLRARSGSVYYPSVDASFTGTRQQASGAAFGQPNAGTFVFSLLSATVGVSYALDVFGGGRRELEGLRSQVDYQRFQLEGTYLTLASNIVAAAVKDASLRAQLKATREIITLQERQLALVERQFQLGGASRTDTLAQQAQLAQSRTGLPPLEKELAQTRNLLAVYTGKLPSEAALPVFDLKKLNLPGELPLSLPSSLVRQRPDIRASEELLHAAGAQVGVATANLYPQITLNGSMGSQATSLQDLFAPGTFIWSLGAGLTQPLFHGGELTAKRRAAIAALDQAGAQYRETLLQAFQNVADVLQAIESDAAALKAQAEAERSARDSLELTQRQFALGAVNYLLLLNAERQHQQALLSLVQAQAARVADSAALFQALGGGWWNRKTESADGNGSTR